MSLEQQGSNISELYTIFIQKLTSPDTWLLIMQKAILIMLILIGMKVGKSIGYTLINRVIVRKDGSRLSLDVRREKTLEKLLKNVLSYTISFIGILMILAQFGIELMPIIAGAGVIGLAVAFGAQNLVRDVITGFFIIFEDQFAVGDQVRIKNYEGKVIEIGLRITKIKSSTGEINIIPNGAIAEVTNYSTNNSVAVIDLKVAYEEDTSRVVSILEQKMDQIYTQGLIPELITKPDVLGIQALGESDLIIRINAECKPTTQSKVKRKLYAIIKGVCEAEGIGPYSRKVNVGLQDDQSSKG